MAIAIPACSKSSVLEKDWLCQIAAPELTAPESEKCQNIAVITSGELLLSSDGSFELKAVFEACYEHIKAHVSGTAYTEIALNKVVEIELIVDLQPGSYFASVRHFSPASTGAYRIHVTRS